MKLNKEQRNVQSSMANSQHFSIKTSAKAFAILSDLYEDKIFAIMRELGTNAFDAHVEAGKGDVPFYVHLPTDIEPWFAIRDYGLGMDQATVMRLYTTYFDSSKTESNDFVGALGLGSKSPFSYTDNFTVESYQNGERKTYLAYLDEDNTPSISHVDDSATSEEDGIKIQFPVRESDHHLFAWKAPKVFYPFTTLPEINLTHEVRLNNVQSDVEKNAYLSGEADEAAYYFMQTTEPLSVLQGNIIYPVQASSIDEEWTEAEERFLSRFGGARWSRQEGSLLLSVPIGTIDFTPSREAISYNTQTKKNLARILRGVMTGYQDRVIEEAKGKDSLSESLQYYGRHTFGTEEEAKDFLSGELEDRGLEDAPIEVEHHGFMTEFLLNLGSTKISDGSLNSSSQEITFLSYKDIGNRVTRKGFSTYTVTGKMPLDKLNERKIIFVDRAKVGYELNKVMYRLKRHMKSDKGELTNDSAIAIVTNKSVLRWLGITDYRTFDKALETISHLREKRTSSGGAGASNKATVPSYRLIGGDGNWQTHNTIAPLLSEYDNVLYFTESNGRGRYSTTEYTGVSETRFSKDALSFVRYMSSAKDVFGTKLAIVEVLNKQEFKKKRFQKMPKANEQTHELNAMVQVHLETWAKSRANIVAYVNSRNRNDDAIRLVKAYIDEYGLNSTTEDSPLRKLATVSDEHTSEVLDRMSKDEKRFVDFYRYRLDNMIGSGSSETMLNSRYPLLTMRRPLDMSHTLYTTHMTMYMKSVEDQAKAAAALAAIVA